jgi:hypothetical protein
MAGALIVAFPSREDMLRITGFALVLASLSRLSPTLVARMARRTLSTLSTLAAVWAIESVLRARSTARGRHCRFAFSGEILGTFRAIRPFSLGGLRPLILRFGSAVFSFRSFTAAGRPGTRG